ncbi:hypothetical protein DH2020_044944 [Rehmannia glutinosa]|uniref:DUF4283 domain-containing protein n=1 Tax=Rehmannia glutinosa TaxID=99300 RepID=A0ABR0UFI3_REHGL
MTLRVGLALSKDCLFMADPPLEGHVSSDNPPPLKSFTDVTSSSSSSHVNLSFDPEKIVPIGTISVQDGQKVLCFSSSEADRLAGAWKLTLIGKFSFAIPQPNRIAKGLCALNLKGMFSWSFANSSHVIKLQLEEDFNRLWMGTIWMVGECLMRVFKWTPTFNPKSESPIAPVWVRFPGLPIHFYDYHALFAICKKIGSPLQVDAATARKTRLSMARVCIEIDLLKERMEEIVLRFNDVVHVQKIVYERVPPYCLDCKHIGHSEENCYMNRNRVKPPPPDRRPRPFRVASDKGKEVEKPKEGFTDNPLWNGG